MISPEARFRRAQRKRVAVATYLRKGKAVTVMTETTPTYDALIEELGDPVVTPPVDRSFARISEQAAHATDEQPVLAVVEDAEE